MNDKKVKIGIMGGTFNPPHLGHLISAEASLKQLSLDKVIFIPTGRISYKVISENVSAFDRYNMVKLIIKDNPLFEISDIETKKNDFSYTFETLKSLKKIYKDAELYFLVGGDSLDYMDKWKMPEEIFSMCTVAVFSRDGFSIEAIEKKIKSLEDRFNAKILIIKRPDIDISSTDLRRKIREGDNVKQEVTEDVLKYIVQNNLYLGDNNDGD